MTNPDTTALNAQPATPQWLRALRHFVAFGFFMAASPFVFYGIDALVHWVGSILAVLLFSAVLSSLAKLFFTRGTGKDWIGNTIKLAWVIGALVLVGEWTSAAGR